MTLYTATPLPLEQGQEQKYAFTGTRMMLSSNGLSFPVDAAAGQDTLTGLNDMIADAQAKIAAINATIAAIASVQAQPPST